MVTVSIGIIGFTMLIASRNPHIKYAGCYLGAAGIYPTIPNTLTWASNNLEGVYKRGVIIGIIVGTGNLQGVVSQRTRRSSASQALTNRNRLVAIFSCSRRNLGISVVMERSWHMKLSSC